MKVMLRHSEQDPVRLSFPNLFEPKQYEGAGPFRYDATALIVPGGANDELIWQAIFAVGEEKLGKKWRELIESWRNNSQKFCYLDGNLKEYEGYEGMMYLAMHRKADDGPPTVIDRNRVRLTRADGRPYAGCYVNVSADIYAQTGTNAGVRASFSGVQFVADGDAFGGGAPAKPEDFEDLGVDEDSADSLV